METLQNTPFGCKAWSKENTPISVSPDSFDSSQHDREAMSQVKLKEDGILRIPTEYLSQQTLLGIIGNLLDKIKCLENSTDHPDVLGQKCSVIKGKENTDVRSNLTRNWSWHGRGTKFSCKFDKLSKPINGQEVNSQIECRSKDLKRDKQVEVFCKYHAMNRCTYGKKCKYVHGPSKLEHESSKKKVCTSCSLWHETKEDCPARGKICFKCNKLNHFSKVCRTKLRNISKSLDTSVSSDKFTFRVVKGSPIIEIDKKSSSVEARTSDCTDEESDRGNSVKLSIETSFDQVDPIGEDSDVENLSSIAKMKEKSSNKKKSRVKKVDPKISKEKAMINWINKQLKTKHQTFDDLKDGKTIRSLLDLSMGLAPDWHDSDAVWKDIKLMICLIDEDIEEDINEDMLEAGHKAEIEKLICVLKKRKEEKMKS